MPTTTVHYLNLPEVHEGEGSGLTRRNYSPLAPPPQAPIPEYDESADVSVRNREFRL
jgi:hypothetical protein